jgi:hypothetical protein
MKRFLSVALLAIFLIPSAIAQHDRQRERDQPEREDMPERDFAGKVALPETPYLFYEFRGSSPVSSSSKIALTVFVDDLPYLVERFAPGAMDTEANKNPIVELLSRDSVRLKTLYDLAEKGLHRVSVAIVADGQTVREFSFDAFVDYNRKLKRHMSSAPQVAESKVYVLRRLVQEGITPADACEDYCQSQYDDCFASQCGQQIYCETCLDQLAQCRDYCNPPPPSCTPTTTQSTSVELTGYYYYLACLTSFPWYTDTLHRRYTLYYKVTVTTYTTYPASCNRAPETSVSITYPIGHCDDDLGFACSYPEGWAACY